MQFEQASHRLKKWVCKVCCWCLGSIFVLLFRSACQAALQPGIAAAGAAVVAGAAGDGDALAAEPQGTGQTFGEALESRIGRTYFANLIIFNRSSTIQIQECCEVRFSM